MADSFGVSIDTKPFRKSLDALQKRVDRATMWALREVGREVKKEARKLVPVGDGSDPRERPGELKKSIGSSRRIKRPAPHVYEIKVGPWSNGHVHLYAIKEEKIAWYMKRAHDAVMPRVPEIYARAVSRAMNRK